MTMIGPSMPNGSNNRAAADNIVRLVIVFPDESGLHEKQNKSSD